MRWLRTLAILLSFVIDVKVHADSRRAERKAEKPESLVEVCKNDECVSTVEKGIHELKHGQAKFYFAPKSTFLIREQKKVHLIRGVVRVVAEAETMLYGLYGHLKLKKGSALIVATDEKLVVTNLSSDVEYNPLGEKIAHALPIGYSTYMAKVTKTGVAEAGFPHPAEIEALIRQWSQVVPRPDYPQMRSQFLEFLVSWRKVTESVGPWYLSVIQREVAALRAQEAEAARLKAKREAEDLQYREMFRRRVFGEN